ncbi:hypothetical protein Cgig2_027190 [Carnegiea gigantea]|uniref:PB1-like domain-containing protein n=1 Tax=Carnegiea gigantea TaxID=171969 RepID=A0A9Q1QNF0_9CARY|nr:hypothetical protein Cgig2_027190 [Carnegiea gigantea]
MTLESNFCFSDVIITTNYTITRQIRHEEKFIQSRKLECEGGSIITIYNFKIDKLSYFEIIGCAKDLGFDNVVEIYYLVPRMSLKKGLGTLYFDYNSLYMMGCAQLAKDMVVYLVHLKRLTGKVHASIAKPNSKPSTPIPKERTVRPLKPTLKQAKKPNLSLNLSLRFLCHSLSKRLTYLKT